MSVICPTVTAFSVDEYGRQIDRIAGFADRIHIDLMDGEFSPTKSPNPIQVWWPGDIEADIHLMFARPHEHIETLISLRPSMVIIHTEAEGDLLAFVNHLKKFDIKVGVALLAPTDPEDFTELIEVADHALIFSGDLGHFGGKVDPKLFQKIATVKRIHPGIEVGWDGGANQATVAQLAAAGIDVINVGGAIQRSDEPEDAYATLVAKLENKKDT
jgi:ribulose-phosphate 3-epimerase